MRSFKPRVTEAGWHPPRNQALHMYHWCEPAAAQGEKHSNTNPGGRHRQLATSLHWRTGSTDASRRCSGPEHSSTPHCWPSVQDRLRTWGCGEGGHTQLTVCTSGLTLGSPAWDMSSHQLIQSPVDSVTSTSCSCIVLLT